MVLGGDWIGSGEKSWGILLDLDNDLGPVGHGQARIGVPSMRQLGLPEPEDRGGCLMTDRKEDLGWKLGIGVLGGGFSRVIHIVLKGRSWLEKDRFRT